VRKLAVQGRRFWIWRRPWLTVGVTFYLFGLGVGLATLAWGNFCYETAAEALLDEDWARARRNVDRALAVWPRRAAVHLLAARIGRLSDDYRSAERQLEECKDLLGEADAALQLEWVLFRAQTGEADKVAAGLQQSLEEHPAEKGAIMEALARGYLSEARWQSTNQILEEWLQIEPDNPKALTLRGLLREYLVMAEAAQHDLERALGIRPSLRTARLNLVEILIVNNNAPAAMSHLGMLATKSPDDRHVQVCLARCQRLLGHTEEARRILDRILTDSPRHAGALVYRAKIACETQPPVEAEEWLSRAISVNPADKDLRYNLYRVLNQSGQKQKAAAALAEYSRVSADLDRLDMLLTKSWDRNPTDPEVAAEIGARYLRLGQTTSAVYWLQLALKRDPQCRSAHRLLTDYYTSRGDNSKAEFHRRRAKTIFATGS